ncbi:proton-conducting transporter transmembrane domain-containing protein [Imhoffiella purpurea]|uniref:NADH-ubiquinone oxidoreductase chain M n=1 Tax=Imhoffiella purpurea TaxID=1249627 RepID=W9V317_9GAMM|nr:proton-conducting transporter membrane subunit [Imhoffiella purpurea]EXJ13739.1 NADH-ubiquinone oxidoreductase chain M [Imhoffiella purpurea]
MSVWLLLGAWVWPLLLAAGARARRLWWLPAVGALPALAAALWLPLGSRLELPWLLLGTSLGLDALARGFLLFTAIVWLAAGIQAAFGLRGRPDTGRFNLMFLLAMAGNLWLIVGQDLVSFYAGFALMGLAAYGLIVHEGDAKALRAGRVYLILALAGEVTLLAGLLMIAVQSGTLTPNRAQLAGLDDPAIALILLGLGVKAGMVPLHVWLPLAHPAAPPAASAVLSGTMIKVALLGWLRFLPVGAAELPLWGDVLTLAGLVTIALSLLVGLVQHDPKVILAYSSISKMGLMILLLGLILAAPDTASLGIAALTLYAAQHALAKGGLFLGVGLRKASAIGQPLVLGGLAVLALALAGAPFTSGAAAKYAIKPLLATADWHWIAGAIAVSAVATSLLMARFVWASTRMERHPEPGYGWPLAGWSGLILLLLAFPFVLGQPAAWTTGAATIGTGLAIAAAIAGTARWRPEVVRRSLGRLVGTIPPGDLLALAAAPIGGLRRLGQTGMDVWRRPRAWIELGGRKTLAALSNHSLANAERRLRRWPVAGSLWLGIAGLLLMGLLVGDPRLNREAPKIAEVSPPSAVVPNDPAQMPAPTEPMRDAETIPSSAVPREGEGDSDIEPQKQPPSDSVRTADPTEALAVGSAVRTESPEPDSQTTSQECDPEQVVVLTSPRDSSDQIRLRPCVEQPSGEYAEVEAPPLTNRLVRLIQVHLDALGFDPGPIDGLIGPRTRSAIRDYQRAKGVDATGAVDFGLIRLLKNLRGSGQNDYK